MKNTYKMICFTAVAAIAACGLVCTVRADELDTQEICDPTIYVEDFLWNMSDLVGMTRILSEDEEFEPTRPVEDYDVNDDGFIDMEDYASINEWVTQTSVQYDYWVSHEEFWLPQLYDMIWQYGEDTGATPEQLCIGVGVDWTDWMEYCSGNGMYIVAVSFSEAYYVQEKERCFGYEFSAQHPWYNLIGYEKSLNIQDGDIVLTMTIWNPGTQEIDFIADRYDAVIERRE